MLDTTPGETRRITRAAVLGYFNCVRKAYLHLFTQERGEVCEYTTILDRAREKTRLQHVDKWTRQGLRVEPFSPDSLRLGSDLISDASLSTELFSTDCAFLIKVAGKSRFGNYQYEPAIVAPAHEMRPEDRFDVLFAGHVLSQVQDALPLHGIVLLPGENTTRVKLAAGMKNLVPYIGSLKKWLREPPEPPSVLLNKHCSYCEYRSVCRSIAEKEDSLSLLGGVTRKIVAKYEKKGIFTVKQLSYLYKPRKHSARRARRLSHQHELQALALRTGNIYLHEPREIPEQNAAIVFDIESVPERRFYYLIGLLLCTAGSRQYFPLWANTEKDEVSVWKNFVDFVERHPGLPLLHYGSFELKAIVELGKRYGTPVENIVSRLVNINTYIFGRIYFPVRSNGLKDICKYIGLSWSSAQASGLQSLVWRHRYEETADERYRQLLLTYNREDCEHLNSLTHKLRDIITRAADVPEVRTSDNIEGNLTPTGSEIVGHFSGILKSAHLTYEKSKIARKKKELGGVKRRPTARQAGGALIKPHRIVIAEPGERCPHHPERALKIKETLSQHTLIDMVFTSRGAKKIITRTIGKQGYCWKCKKNISPPQIRQLNRDSSFGHGLKTWVVYHRLALRLSYRNIAQLMSDMFSQDISTPTLIGFINQLSEYHAQTEAELLKKILSSPAVHVDETSINMQGKNWYVWVFTDGRRAVFRLTQTRESTIVHDMLAGYSGVLISDFYAGYDALECVQQKCWVHLIRDLNEDLRKAPFDAELERFVSAVKDLLAPIFVAVDKYGAKARNLRKFVGSVERFYKRHVKDVAYQSDLVKHYQKRFARYREQLFVFLSRDGVAWNNNMAERAIRHLAVQRKISGSFFESGMQQYLLLLGITQSCRFQGKSLLEFLLSGCKDLDAFKGSGRRSLGGKIGGR